MLVEDESFWLIVHVRLLCFLKQETFISDILYMPKFALKFSVM